MTGNIGSKILETRKRKKLTQQQLADQLGLSERTISAYETGSIIPSANVLFKLCRVLEIKTDYLLGLDNRVWICVDKLNQFEIELLEQIVISLRCKKTDI